MKTYIYLDLFNRQQWRFDLQSSQCQDTVHQEGATTNQMQIKLYAELYDNNTHIHTFVLNRITINNIQTSFWITKLCIQRKMKKIPNCDSKEKKKSDIYRDVPFSVFTVECFCRNIPWFGFISL